MEKTILKDSEQLHQLYQQGVDGDLLERLGRALAHTQRLANIGALTTGVAHELTSPLSAITSACSSLLNEMQNETLDQQVLEQHVALIERSVFRSVHIVDVLHNYAYADEPHMAVTTVEAILRDSLKLVEHQFLLEGDIKIEVDLSDQLGSVICDHNRITQVLVNLLTNAYDAMLPQGGMIKVGFWALPPGRPEPGNGYARGKNGVRKFAFAVADDGHGIEPDIVDEIFQPFFTTRAGREGIGLGLFIAKGIVQQHNGHIWVENNPGPGGGVTSTVILPVRPSSE
jgi:signal transduction histidine kinase